MNDRQRKFYAEAIRDTPEWANDRQWMCRYTDQATTYMCTAEAAVKGAEILLCTEHLAMALRLLRGAGAARGVALV